MHLRGTSLLSVRNKLFKRPKNIEQVYIYGQVDLSLIKEMSERPSVGKTKGSINRRTKAFF